MRGRRDDDEMSANDDRDDTRLTSVLILQRLELVGSQDMLYAEIERSL